MAANRPYAWLCGTLGTALVAIGLFLFASFFVYHAPNSKVAIPTGPVGIYLAAFAGCALVGWGGGLLATARRPETGRSIGSVTAFALVMMAAYRILAWVVGDYYVLFGELLRVEAGLFLGLALAFLWLRPAAPRPERA